MEQNSPELDPNTNGNLVYGKSGISNHWGKDELFNIQFWNNQVVIWKTIKLNPYLTSSGRINSKQIRNLNVKPETTQYKEKHS